MHKKAIRITLAIFVLFLSSCDDVQEPASVLIASDGTQYKVFSKRNVLFEKDKMLVITYLSSDPENESIRKKEFQDLYQITADNINPKSDYDYVALVAMKKQNKKFGINKNSGYRDRRKFSDVMLLKNDS
jgi:hypothetical protein